MPKNTDSGREVNLYFEPIVLFKPFKIKIILHFSNIIYFLMTLKSLELLT